MRTQHLFRKKCEEEETRASPTTTASPQTLSSFNSNPRTHKTPPSQPSKSIRDIFLPFPVPGARRDIESGLYVLASASTAASTSAGYEDESAGEREEKEARKGVGVDEYEFPSGNWNPPLMRRMYSDCLAGRGIFNPKRLRLEALREALEDDLEKEAEEARQVFRKQRRFFGLADDGRAFRDVFVDVDVEICEGDVGDILKIDVSPKTKVRMNSEGSVGRALGDESLHGLMVSPRIVGSGVVGEKGEEQRSEGEDATGIVELGIDGATPGKEWGEYEYLFNGWSSFSPKDEKR